MTEAAVGRVLTQPGSRHPESPIPEHRYTQSPKRAALPVRVMREEKESRMPAALRFRPHKAGFEPPDHDRSPEM